ncbi:hypothetical protein [Luteolibacter marinus]|uniref:hypothetical protein n=1 Tax=Luteolibacter marinus TaxID=2776705 RepID=UPI0018663348|nr:hypothetical protein [Luteolibacter marinus]
MQEERQVDLLAAEIRALRQDVRRGFRNALWVFMGAVILICLTFGPRIPKSTVQVLVATGIGVLFFYLVGRVFQSAFNARLRKRNERERFAILSGRAPAARRGH